jgi:Tol biopolymer transport system component
VPRIGNPAAEPVISRSANGTSRLIWSRGSADANIYRLELSRDSQKAANPQPWIASVFRDVFPQYSPEGSDIAFYSERSGVYEVWACHADGSNPRKLSRVPHAPSMSPRWSPDGKEIVFDVFSVAIYRLYLMPSEGGVAKQLTWPPSSNYGGNWSLDGRWLYFSSDRDGTDNV